MVLARQDLGIYLDIVMAPQPRGPSGPMAQDRLTITETQDAQYVSYVSFSFSSVLDLNALKRGRSDMHCDTFSSREDEHARCAVLLQFPCEQYHIGVTNWINNIWENQTYQPTTNPSGFIAKQVAYPPDSYSRRELSVKTLWPDKRMMESPTKLIVHFQTAEPISQSASPSHLKTGKSENVLRPQNSQQRGSQKRRGKTSVQTCSILERTVV